MSIVFPPAVSTDVPDRIDSVIDGHDASAALPVAPTVGDRYICTSAGTGWTLGYVYEWTTSSAWQETIPTLDCRCYVEVGATVLSAQTDYVYVGSGVWYDEQYFLGLASKTLIVDTSRTDIYTETGTEISPYKLMATAIAAASSGDTILVKDCAIVEDVIIDGKTNLHIKSYAGKKSVSWTGVTGLTIQVKNTSTGCIIDGFSFISGASTTFFIEITNASADCKFRNNLFTVAGNVSQGISIGVNGCSGMEITDNEFAIADGKGGIYGADISACKVSNNRFTVSGSTPTSGYGCQFDGCDTASEFKENFVSLQGMSGIFLQAHSATKDVDGAIIENNYFTGTTAKALRLGHTTSANDVKNLVIRYNRFYENTVGIFSDNSANVDPTSYTIEMNDFDGNVTYAVQNAKAADMVVSHNWWGAFDGCDDDDGNINGSGDKVSANTTILPYDAKGVYQNLSTTASPLFAKVGLTDNTTAAYKLELDSDSSAVALNADRVLVIDVNNADRNVDLAGNLIVESTSTLNQDLTTDASPKFANVKLTDNTTAGHTLAIDSDSSAVILDADRTLTFDVNNADRNVDLAGDLIVEATSTVNQDLTTDATPNFANIKLTDNTTAAYKLILDSDSDGDILDADRTLTFDVHNADRTLDMQANLTVEATSLINQDLTTDGAPTFASVQVTDAGTAFDMLIVSDSTTEFTADKTLTVDLDNAARTLKLAGNLTVESASIVNQDLTTDADVQFKDATLTGSLSVAQEMIWGGTAIAHGASPYDIVATIKILDVDVSGGAFTGNLPAATGTGRVIIVNDVKGNCNNNNITIDPNGSEQINSLGAGVAYVMTEAHQCTWLRDSASGQWSIIAQY